MKQACSICRNQSAVVLLLVLLFCWGCDVRVRKNDGPDVPLRRSDFSVIQSNATPELSAPEPRRSGWQISLLRRGDFSRATYEFEELNSLVAQYAQNAKPGLQVLMETEPESALAVLTSFISDHPDSGFAYLVRGELHLKMADFDSAITDITTAIHLFSDEFLTNNLSLRAVVYGLRGQAFLRTGELDRAVRDLNEAIQSDAEDGSLYYDRAVTYQRLEDYQHAINDYDTAIGLNASDASLYFGRGTVFYHLREFERAIDDLTKAISLQPTNPAAYYNRAYALMDSGDAQRAIVDMDKAIQLAPNDPDFYVARAHIYTVTFKFEEAINDYGRAIELEPDSPVYCRARAHLLDEVGRWQEARSDYLTLLRRTPLDPEADSDFAWLLSTCPDESIRDGKKAVMLATQACEVSGWTNLTYIGTLAAACAELGDFENAVHYQEKVVSAPGETERVRKEELRRLKLFERHEPYREERPGGRKNGSHESEE